MKYLKRFLNEAEEFDINKFPTVSVVNTYRYILEDDSRWKVFIIHPHYFTAEYDRGHKDYYDTPSWMYDIGQNPDYLEFLQRIKDDLLPNYFVSDSRNGTKIHIKIKPITV